MATGEEDHKHGDPRRKPDIPDEGPEHPFHAKGLVGDPAHGQGCPAPSGEMTANTTTAFFSEPGVSFR